MPAADDLYPNQDAVSYHVALPRDDYQAWKTTIPRSIPLYKRFHTLIRRDTLARQEGDTPDTTAFAIVLDAGLAEDWTDSLALNETRSERAEKLIREDHRQSEGSEWDTESERMVRLLANRIGHRARTARDALGNEDEGKVREELEAIIEAAGEIEG